MDCPTCIPLLEKEIKQLPGIVAVQGNYVNKLIKISYNSDHVQLEEIEATIERLGYRIAYKKYPSVFSRIKRAIVGKKDREITTITDSQFADIIGPSANSIAVVFSSPTCPPCLYFKRQLKADTRITNETMNIYEMDITNTVTWQQYDVMSIPTVLIFRNGQIIKRFEALPPIKEILHALRTEN
jgi:thioredoxin 1